MRQCTAGQSMQHQWDVFENVCGRAKVSRPSQPRQASRHTAYKEPRDAGAMGEKGVRAFRFVESCTYLFCKRYTGTYILCPASRQSQGRCLSRDLSRLCMSCAGQNATGCDQDERYAGFVLTQPADRYDFCSFVAGSAEVKFSDLSFHAPRFLQPANPPAGFFTGWVFAPSRDTCEI